MTNKPYLVASALTLALWGASAQATDYFCNNFVAGSPPAHFQCVQTTVGPGTPLLLSPDQAGSGTIFASSVSAGSGVEASLTSASATASPGLLRGKASAQMLLGSIPSAIAVARSDAWFASGGTVIGASGVAVGTPVSLRFTIDVAGGFAGGGIFTSLSEATVDLVAGQIGGSSIYTGAQIDKYNPARLVFKDVVASVGDSFEMIMKLHVSANASFVGTDGHLYATLAPVPEPASYALLLSGLMVIGGAVSRRRGARGATGALPK